MCSQQTQSLMASISGLEIFLTFFSSVSSYRRLSVKTGHSHTHRILHGHSVLGFISGTAELEIHSQQQPTRITLFRHSSQPNFFLYLHHLPTSGPPLSPVLKHRTFRLSRLRTMDCVKQQLLCVSVNSEQSEWTMLSKLWL